MGAGDGRVVRLEVEEGIGTIRLDRPRMNVIDVRMQLELREAAQEASGRDDVRAVVVYGGEATFAAGVDVKEMQAMSHADMLIRAPDLMACFTAVAQIPKPTVAAITGYALGGGCEVTLCCDFRIAAADATLGQPEVLLGIIPGAGGTQRLARLVGPARAKDLIFTGRFVSAPEALEMGLVDAVVPADEVYAAARAKMAPLVAGAPLALRAAKEAVDFGLETDLVTGLAYETARFAACFGTRDRAAGMASFIENGPGKARFEGR